MKTGQAHRFDSFPITMVPHPLPSTLGYTTMSRDSTITRCWYVAATPTKNRCRRSNPRSSENGVIPWSHKFGYDITFHHHKAGRVCVTDKAVKVHRLRIYPPGTLLVSSLRPGKNARPSGGDVGMAATMQPLAALRRSANLM